MTKTIYTPQYLIKKINVGKYFKWSLVFTNLAILPKTRNYIQTKLNVSTIIKYNYDYLIRGASNMKKDITQINIWMWSFVYFVICKNNLADSNYYIAMLQKNHWKWRSLLILIWPRKFVAKIYTNEMKWIWDTYPSVHLVNHVKFASYKYYLKWCQMSELKRDHVYF